jgi:hypothetical protein
MALRRQQYRLPVFDCFAEMRVKFLCHSFPEMLPELKAESRAHIRSD